MKGDKKKGDSEESPNEKERVDEFVNEWCRLYRETSQALARIQRSTLHTGSTRALQELIR